MAATAYELLAFGLFAAVTLGSSLAVVLVRDVWHAALFLGVALLSVAVHFVMLQAEFLAAMQVLVYVGGVLILISFAVMLVRRDVADRDVVNRPSFRFGSHLFRGVGALALLVVLVWATIGAGIGDPAGFPGDGSITATIGYAIVGLVDLAEHETESFLAALIITGVLLDAALDGAVMLARRDEPGTAAEAVRSDGGENR